MALLSVTYRSKQNALNYNDGCAETESSCLQIICNAMKRFRLCNLICLLSFCLFFFALLHQKRCKNYKLFELFPVHRLKKCLYGNGK